MRQLRILHVEDSPDDSARIIRELERGGYAVTATRVSDAGEMAAELERGGWDLVVAEFQLARFSAVDAFRLVRERGLDVPFLIVSAALSEEAAVDAMRAGVRDALHKTNLARLVPAVDRELREAAIRTEQRLMQEQLLVSDRMASVGALAAGVAHEINNPLAALILGIEFAVEELAALDAALGDGASSAVRERLTSLGAPLRDARDAAERMRVIMRDLKIFSRSREDERRGPVDLKGVLESTLRMAWNEIRHRARLTVDYQDIPAAAGNESRLGQVFLNLIVNAAHAVPEGRVDDNEIAVRTYSRGDAIVVEIQDTGTGIAEEHLAHIFQPFFTTKPAGIGTGLGLAICHRIVSEMAGSIEVDSAPGRGSRFRVVLQPATMDDGGIAAAPAADPAQAGGEPLPHRARILIIDDEPIVLRGMARVLSPYHDVLPLMSVRDALDELRGGHRFDVILCDLMMPQMTGMDLHAELIRIAPEQAARIVFATGGAFTPMARDFLDRVPNTRVEKPIDPRNLRLLVANLLARA